jgi:hypothetical protein
MIDPFTGCFISRIPFTVVYLRLALKAASFFKNNKNDHQGTIFLEMGTKRLHEIIQELKKDPNPLIKKYHEEKEVWDSYYDIFIHVEDALKSQDIFALELQERAGNLVKDCRMVG